MTAAGQDFSFVWLEIDDVEERGELQAMLDAVRDLVPDVVVVTDQKHAAGTIAFGRVCSIHAAMGEFAWPQGRDFDLPYWEMPTFLENARRSFVVGDVDAAHAEVDRLHAAGIDAFVKATRTKLMTLHVPVGTDFHTALDAMIYSFIDIPDCLMVQPYVRMEHEYRMFVVDGEVVTAAGCVPHHTPADNEAVLDTKMSRCPGGDVVHDPELVAAYLSYAQSIVPRLPVSSFVLDVAMIDGEIGVVELNFLIPGRVGLYACDVEALAKASVVWVTRETMERGRVAKRVVTQIEARPTDEAISWTDASPLISEIRKLRFEHLGR